MCLISNQNRLSIVHGGCYFRPSVGVFRSFAALSIYRLVSKKVHHLLHPIASQSRRTLAVTCLLLLRGNYVVVPFAALPACVFMWGLVGTINNSWYIDPTPGDSFYGPSSSWVPQGTPPGQSSSVRLSGTTAHHNTIAYGAIRDPTAGWTLENNP